jgi:hypothetical protein
MVHEETRKQRKGAKTDLERIRARQKERREKEVECRRERRAEEAGGGPCLRLTTRPPCTQNRQLKINLIIFRLFEVLHEFI